MKILTAALLMAVLFAPPIFAQNSLSLTATSTAEATIITTIAASEVRVRQGSGPFVAYYVTDSAATPGRVRIEPGGTYSFFGTNGGGYNSGDTVGSVRLVAGAAIAFEVIQLPKSSGPVPNTLPSAGQVPVGNAGGTAYAPQTISGSCTLSSAGVMTCSGGLGFTYNTNFLGRSSALGDTTMVTVGVSNAPYLFIGSVSCTGATSGAAVTMNLKFTDTSNTAQVVSVTANCTTLGGGSYASLTWPVNAKASTTVTIGATITGSPTFDVVPRLIAE